MVLLWHMRTGEYHDSITLMQATQKLRALPGVSDAAVVMGTESNLALLKSAGLWDKALEAATPTDVLLVVLAEDDSSAREALSGAERVLAPHRESAATGSGAALRSLRAAIRQYPESNLAVISVAGRFATEEAWSALRQGLNVLLFSDNVPLAHEVELKTYAESRGLLVMGPGCGTALINGAALGFANAVGRGPVGLVAAAGTGLQEVSSLLDRLGAGITQGIGTGGRDLSIAVGGITMRQGLCALQQDKATQAIVLISKPPAASIARRVIGQVGECDKPCIVCFLGQDTVAGMPPNARPAHTLQEAAYLAAQAVGCGQQDANAQLAEEERVLQRLAAQMRSVLNPAQRYLRGVFSGGTLVAEAQVVWRDMGLRVSSNAPLDESLRMRDAAKCEGHCALDLGEEEFTVGRPHPMIDHDLRVRRIAQEAADPQVAALVLDVVLGYGAHPDPAGVLGPAIQRARATATQEGRTLHVICSITGTKGDPQGLERQTQQLADAGAEVCSCNAAAARLAGELVAPADTAGVGR